MKTQKVVSMKNIPTRFPLLQTAVAYLLLDKFHAVEWVWGAAGVLFVLIWIACIVQIIKEDKVELEELKS